MAAPSPLYYLHLCSSLLQRLSGSKGLSGVKLGDTEHGISLYADVLLFIMTQLFLML